MTVFDIGVDVAANWIAVNGASGGWCLQILMLLLVVDCGWCLHWDVITTMAIDVLWGSLRQQ